jgi:hypothetical protein
VVAVISRFVIDGSPWVGVRDVRAARSKAVVACDRVIAGVVREEVGVLS